MSWHPPSVPTQQASQQPRKGIMSTFERWQVLEALKQPSPQKGHRPLDIRESLHSEREGEYERYSVLAALKAAARANLDKGVE